MLILSTITGFSLSGQTTKEVIDFEWLIVERMSFFGQDRHPLTLTLARRRVSIHAKALGCLDHSQDILRLALIYDGPFGQDKAAALAGGIDQLFAVL
jgi:hypothetical protein